MEKSNSDLARKWHFPVLLSYTFESDTLENDTLERQTPHLRES